MREDMEDFCSTFSYMHSWESMLFRKKGFKAPVLVYCSGRAHTITPNIDLIDFYLQFMNRGVSYTKQMRSPRQQRTEDFVC